MAGRDTPASLSLPGSGYASTAKARAKLGLSQAALAALVGWQPRNMRQWEAGDRQINAAAARLVRAYLDGYRPDDWPVAHEKAGR